MRGDPNRPPHSWRKPMDDILWLGLIVVLLVATLGYVRLCDNG
jgi:hypothetical protein